MPIDKCKFDFATLAQTVFPKYFEQLQNAMQATRKASEFSMPGVGPAKMAKELGLPTDFSGCYVLIDGTKPIYVGISRTVLQRLRQHVTGRGHNDASLAYRMAKKHCQTPGSRSEAMKIEKFDQEFKRQQAYLKGLNVAFIAIENPLELYAFEVFAAMALDTSEWNTFRTH